MKRPRNRQKPTKKQPAAPAAAAKKGMSRRDVMGWAKFGALGLAVFGGGGWYFTRKVMAGIAEADLSKLGNGMPTIVQVHDPACSSCERLQQATRTALEAFRDGAIQYLVANLNDPEGRDFAQGHGVGRVTLLLFDAKGKRVGMISGARSSSQLTAAFRRYLAQVTARKTG